MLSNVVIKAAIAKAQRRQLERAEKRFDDSVDVARKYAYTDLTRIYDPASTLT